MSMGQQGQQWDWRKVAQCVRKEDSGRTFQQESRKEASYKPLLKQVVEEIFNPEKPDPTDIEHTSSGLTDLLKTGFSMFMKVSRPHPSDHPLLILFVVGGITVSEAKMVKDLVASLKTGTQVMVLSTRLLKPLNIPELLFATDRLHPDLGF
ncbi:Sec1 family domain-containing protein 2 [Cricetulus griseus]|uniref:Sec1 family domain-containing protein 2 n=1 Tax=Cricetulus griseus TaxID=10029 RepID=G3IHJ8_CRIGR|nr:Sec1 family domain-containing protein 2 [Cricetulus griseus]